jgi:hypothetical protein
MVTMMMMMVVMVIDDEVSGDTFKRWLGAW